MDTLTLKDLGLLPWALAITTYFVVRSVYRLWFHPLATIPGPWIAAVSSNYEFYWDCLKAGKYFERIEEMHEKYGPIVRINPWEVHINDAVFADLLLADSKMDKDYFYYRGFGTDTAAFASISAGLNRMRREPMAPFFSRANVKKLEARVLSRVRQLCSRIEEFAAKDQPVALHNAFRCLAADVVTDYAVPETKASLAHPDFSSYWVRSQRDFSSLISWNRHIPFVLPILRSVPRALVAALDSNGAITGVVDNQLYIYNQAKAVVEGTGTSTKTTPTVTKAIFESPHLPVHEKSIRRIFDEIEVVIGAGTETTGHTLTLITYHVLSNSRILRALKQELEKAASEHNVSQDEYLDFNIIESLPYLQAVMKETLRHETAVPGRLPRRHPTAAQTYTSPSNKVYLLPPGTTMSVSIRDVHLNGDIFPSPHEFLPERWLTSDAQEMARMNKYMLAFGKGVRSCLGMELAKQEILLTAGNLFWKYDMELYETSAMDVAFVHDFFAAFPPREREGLKVRVKM